MLEKSLEIDHDFKFEMMPAAPPFFLTNLHRTRQALRTFGIEGPRPARLRTANMNHR